MTTIGSASYHDYRFNYAGLGKTNSGTEDEGTPASQLAGAGNASQNGVDGSAPRSLADFKAGLLSSGGLKPVNIAELPEDAYQTYMDGEERRLEANARYLENQYTDTSWTESVEASLKAFPPEDNPATQTYATVVVDGEVVATIDNQGVVSSDEELGAKLRDILSDEVNGTNGPDLAQARAEQIADLLGGEIVKADTAITQTEFEALPSAEELQQSVDYEAMKKDPMFEQLQNMIARMENLKEQREEYVTGAGAGTDVLI